MADDFTEDTPADETPKDISELDTQEIHGKIKQIDIDVEMRSSYLDYAMSVIVGRALPDVRDGMKPVHRRVIYAMFDGGYRPDKGYNKCSRVVGDVMGKYHPHGDVAIYDTLVRMVQDWTLRYPLIDGQGNFGSESNPKAAAPRYTECKMGKLSMELVRDIEKDTVDFEPNYDGKDLEPTVLPSRYPNLLVNGSSGIAVGMATNIPPHNLREVSEGAIWYLEHPEATNEELLENLLGIVKGPDFPTGAIIYGMSGIQKAYKTGRGIVTMRAKVDIEEEKSGKVNLVVKQLPYQVNPDNLTQKIVQCNNDKIIEGISSVDDFSSGRTGLNIVVGLKRDATPKVVLENLYKHTQLQDSFGCNMLALVDGVPRTLSLDAFIRHWVDHQVDVVVRRTKFLLNQAEERAHVLSGYLLALDAIDKVIALIRGSKDRNIAKDKLIDFLKVDEIQADAILELRLHRLAALERLKIEEEFNELQEKIKDYNDIISNPVRQRTIIKDELVEIVGKFGDDRRTEIVPGEIDQDMESLIKRENIVITISSDGFLKRTVLDEYRTTHRGKKGIQGVKLRDEDSIEHFLVTSTHDWILLFTNQGRVFRIKGYKIPVGSRDTKGQHINNLIELLPNEKLQQVLNISAYDEKKYLVLATKFGKVKKTLLSEYDTHRQGGLKAINLNILESGELDELISAKLIDDEENIIIASSEGKAVHFVANEKNLRAMGRTTAGNKGITLGDGHSVVSMDVVEPDSDILTVTNLGYAKRSDNEGYSTHSRGTKGMKVASFDEKRGTLVGLLTVKDDDELMVIMASGKVVRSKVSEIGVVGRTSKGVIFAKPEDGDTIIKVAKNDASKLEVEEEIEHSDQPQDQALDSEVSESQ
jgi:DNA gyrase subunit A